MGSVYYRAPWWWVAWTERGEKKYLKFISEELARRALAKIVSDYQAKGVGIEPEALPGPTLASLWEAWFETRKLKVRSHGDDASRWRTHLEPFFGHHAVDEIDRSTIRRFIEAKLAAGLNPQTIERCTVLLSAMFEDFVEDGVVTINPQRTVGKRTKKLMRSTHDPSKVPILERPEIERVYRELEAPYSTAFAICALAGLRPGEVVALDWRDVHLDAKSPTGESVPWLFIHRQVRHGKLIDVPKDGESRQVPILASLLPILRSWKLASGGEGLVVRPVVKGRGRVSESGTAFVKNETLNAKLVAALRKARVHREGLHWYAATKHSFSTHWVASGGSLEKLALVLGHSMTFVTGRYQHLRLDHFDPVDYGRVAVDLTSTKGKVLKLQKAAVSCGQDTEQPVHPTSKAAKVS